MSAFIDPARTPDLTKKVDMPVMILRKAKARDEAKRLILAGCANPDGMTAVKVVTSKMKHLMAQDNKFGLEKEILAGMRGRAGEDLIMERALSYLPDNTKEVLRDENRADFKSR